MPLRWLSARSSCLPNTAVTTVDCLTTRNCTAHHTRQEVEALTADPSRCSAVTVWCRIAGSWSSPGLCRLNTVNANMSHTHHGSCSTNATRHGVKAALT